MTTDTTDAASPAAARDATAAAGGSPAADRREAVRPVTAPAPAGRVVGIVLIVLALLLAAGAVWFVQDRIARVERDLARRLQETELHARQQEQQARVLADTLREAQGKAAVLEAKLADSLGQQSQLRQLYDEMARTRGDLMLADVENSIMIAAQQLQLAGNVQSALLALQDAEAVLARSNQPALIGLRRVLTRDIERLKAVPVADFAAAVNRLDAVIAAIDQMPLLADLRPPPGAAAARPAADEPPVPDGLAGLPERMARTGQRGWESFVGELRQLFRVQRMDRSEALLLTPDQRFFARESLRLQLLNARLNLLARNEALFRGDLARAADAIGAWFDARHPIVASASAAVDQLRTTRLAIDLPSLGESVAAVRSARAASDAR